MGNAKLKILMLAALLGGQFIGVSSPYTYSGQVDYQIGGKQYLNGDFFLKSPTDG